MASGSPDRPTVPDNELDAPNDVEDTHRCSMESSRHPTDCSCDEREDTADFQTPTWLESSSTPVAHSATPDSMDPGPPSPRPDRQSTIPHGTSQAPPGLPTPPATRNPTRSARRSIDPETNLTLGEFKIPPRVKKTYKNLRNALDGRKPPEDVSKATQQPTPCTPVRSRGRSATPAPWEGLNRETSIQPFQPPTPPPAPEPLAYPMVPPEAYDRLEEKANSDPALRTLLHAVSEPVEHSPEVLEEFVWQIQLVLREMELNSLETQQNLIPERPRPESPSGQLENEDQVPQSQIKRKATSPPGHQYETKDGSVLTAERSSKGIKTQRNSSNKIPPVDNEDPSEDSMEWEKTKAAVHHIRGVERELHAAEKALDLANQATQEAMRRRREFIEADDPWELMKKWTAENGEDSETSTAEALLSTKSGSAADGEGAPNSEGFQPEKVQGPDSDVEMGGISLQPEREPSPLTPAARAAAIKLLGFQPNPVVIHSNDLAKKRQGKRPDPELSTAEALIAMANSRRSSSLNTGTTWSTPPTSVSTTSAYVLTPEDEEWCQPGRRRKIPAKEALQKLESRLRERLDNKLIGRVEQKPLKLGKYTYTNISGPQLLPPQRPVPERLLRQADRELQDIRAGRRSSDLFPRLRHLMPDNPGNRGGRLGLGMQPPPMQPPPMQPPPAAKEASPRFDLDPEEMENRVDAMEIGPRDSGNGSGAIPPMAQDAPPELFLGDPMDISSSEEADEPLRKPTLKQLNAQFEPLPRAQRVRFLMPERSPVLQTSSNLQLDVSAPPLRVVNVSEPTASEPQIHVCPHGKRMVSDGNANTGPIDDAHDYEPTSDSTAEISTDSSLPLMLQRGPPSFRPAHNASANPRITHHDYRPAMNPDLFLVTGNQHAEPAYRPPPSLYVSHRPYFHLDAETHQRVRLDVAHAALRYARPIPLPEDCSYLGPTDITKLNLKHPIAAYHHLHEMLRRYHVQSHIEDMHEYRLNLAVRVGRLREYKPPAGADPDRALALRLEHEELMELYYEQLQDRLSWMTSNRSSSFRSLERSMTRRRGMQGALRAMERQLGPYKTGTWQDEWEDSVDWPRRLGRLRYGVVSGWESARRDGWGREHEDESEDEGGWGPEGYECGQMGDVCKVC